MSEEAETRQKLEVQQTTPTVMGGVMNLLLIALLVIFIGAVVAVASFGVGGKGHLTDGASKVLGWTMTLPDGSVREVSLPLVMETDSLEPGSTVVFESDVQASEGDYLYLSLDYVPYRVYVDGHLVGSYGEAGSQPAAFADPVPAARIYRLGEAGGLPDGGRTAQATVRIEIETPSHFWGIRLPSVLVGGIEQVTRSFMGAMAWQIYLSVVIFAVGVLSVVVSYLVGHRGRQGASFFWLGLFLTLAGVWGFAGTPIVTLLIKRPLLMHVIVYSCFFASAAPFARLVRTITRDDPSRVMDAMVVLVEGTALVALALQLLGGMAVSAERDRGRCGAGCVLRLRDLSHGCSCSQGRPPAGWLCPVLLCGHAAARRLHGPRGHQLLLLAGAARHELPRDGHGPLYWRSWWPRFRSSYA